MEIIFKTLQENLRNKFALQAILGKTKGIRKGYYFINDVKYVDYSPAGEVAIATVNWNSDDDKTFLDKTYFEICLESLYNKDSVGPKHILAADLTGKYIAINLIEQRSQFLLGRERKMLVANWEVININPSFLNSQSFLLHHLSNGDRNATATEMWNNFASQAPYDANGASNDEGYGDSLDYDGDYIEE